MSRRQRVNPPILYVYCLIINSKSTQLFSMWTARYEHNHRQCIRQFTKPIPLYPKIIAQKQHCFTALSHFCTNASTHEVLHITPVTVIVPSFVMYLPLSCIDYWLEHRYTQVTCSCTGKLCRDILIIHLLLPPDRRVTLSAAVWWHRPQTAGGCRSLGFSHAVAAVRCPGTWGWSSVACSWHSRQGPCLFCQKTMAMSS